MKREGASCGRKSGEVAEASAWRRARSFPHVRSTLPTRLCADLGAISAWPGNLVRIPSFTQHAHHTGYSEPCTAVKGALTRWAIECRDNGVR
jgi:hypothetical protein